MALEDARDRATWLKGSLDNYPHLQLPPAQVFRNAIALKSYASKQLNWLLDPLKLKLWPEHGEPQKVESLFLARKIKFVAEIISF